MGESGPVLDRLHHRLETGHLITASGQDAHRSLDAGRSGRHRSQTTRADGLHVLAIKARQNRSSARAKRVHQQGTLAGNSRTAQIDVIADVRASKLAKREPARTVSTGHQFSLILVACTQPERIESPQHRTPISRRRYPTSRPVTHLPH